MVAIDSIECPACHTIQDPLHPICVHLIGKKGGDSTRRRRGRKFYQDIGRKGGTKRRKSP